MNDEFYFIGDIAKELGIHEQTIRTYEKKKLIKPKRNKNNIRIFNPQDIIKIVIIITLTQELGISLTGVRFIFALAKNKNLSWEFLLDFIDEHKNEIQMR